MKFSLHNYTITTSESHIPEKELFGIGCVHVSGVTWPSWLPEVVVKVNLIVFLDAEELLH